MTVLTAHDASVLALLADNHLTGTERDLMISGLSPGARPIAAALITGAPNIAAHAIKDWARANHTAFTERMRRRVR